MPSQAFQRLHAMTWMDVSLRRLAEDQQPAK
jgi:hypothetical protein